MIKPSKRFLGRAKGHLRRYQKILESARARDVGESDTVLIATDFLADVLGYNKYSEITAEFVIRSTFCDLAIKTNGQLRFLIEVKAIGTELKENHLRQAVDYGANQGAEWVLLTNGAEWRAYRIRFEQPVSHDLVFDVDLLDPACKNSSLLDMLFLISREALGGDAIDRYWRQKEATNRFVVTQILLSPPLLATLRRELRRLAPGLQITEEMLVNCFGSKSSSATSWKAKRLIWRPSKFAERLGGESGSAQLRPRQITRPPSRPQAACPHCWGSDH